MIKSMTGYGKQEGEGFVVEMRSVNHKFLDLSMKLPRDLMPLESRIKKSIGERFSRGRIEVFITRGGSDEAPKSLTLDADAARQYVSLLTELKTMFDLPGDITLSMLASYKDIVAEVEESEDIEAVWTSLEGPLGLCMESMDDMRAKEGDTLAKDMLGRVGSISSLIDEVEKKAPLVVAEYARKLKERVAKLTDGMELDKDRLHQEVAIYADRCDITEEVVRGRSHIKQFMDLVGSDGPVGQIGRAHV